MARLISVLVYLLIFLPIWLFRKLTGVSRFERQFHRTPSAWDRLIAPAPTPQPDLTARPARQGE